jgi:DNA adenine methylase
LQDADYKEMAELLSQITGKFLLSLNNVPRIRELFAAFYLLPVDVPYSVAKKGPQTGRELLISNFPME